MNSVALTIKGAMKVAVPATFGVLTTVAAFFPLMFINGKLGNILGQQAMVVIAVLIFALVESKLILPSHLAQVKIKRNPKKTLWSRIQSRVQGGLQKVIDDYYAPSIRWVLRHRIVGFLSTVVIFVLVVGLIPMGQVRVSFFPDIEPSVVMASFEVQESFGKRHTHEIIDRMEHALMETNAQLKEKYSMDLDPITAIYISSSDNTSASITGELLEDSLRDFDAAEASSTWREIAGQFEGVSVLNFEGSRRGPAAVQIELKAKEMTTLSAASTQLRQAMSQIEGVKDIRDNLKVNQPQLSIKVKPAAYSLGLTNSDVMEQVSTALYGSEAQKIQRGTDEVRVMVRYPAEERTYLSSIENLMIHTSDGSTIPFYVVAETSYINSVSQIDRLDRYRASSIITGVDKRLISSEEVVNILQADAIPTLLQSYPDLKIELKGEASEKSKSTDSLSQGFLVALLVIYGLLAIPLGSYTRPFVIMSIIPYGVLGSILGHWIVGINLGLLSLFGTIALCGVVVNDSLVLVTKFIELKDKGMETIKAIEEAGKTRLRAIVLTSLTTFAGLTPMLLDDSSQAQFLIPMAVSLGFGILFATFTTLYALPIILSFQDSVVSFTQRIKKPSCESLAEYGDVNEVGGENR
ncbi:MAG: efflux RND transporter permease subunit [Candidatus Thiodiazotropha sp. L084R]